MSKKLNINILKSWWSHVLVPHFLLSSRLLELVPWSSHMSLDLMKLLLLVKTNPAGTHLTCSLSCILARSCSSGELPTWWIEQIARLAPERVHREDKGSLVRPGTADGERSQYEVASDSRSLICCRQECAPQGLNLSRPHRFPHRMTERFQTCCRQTHWFI